VGHMVRPTCAACFPILALLQVGFAVPRMLPPRAVRSLPHHFTLTGAACAALRRYLFCCTFRGLTPPQALPGTVPYGARTFLHVLAHTSDCLADS